MNLITKLMNIISHRKSVAGRATRESLVPKRLASSAQQLLGIFKTAWCSKLQQIKVLWPWAPEVSSGCKPSIQAQAFFLSQADLDDVTETQ